MIAELECPWCGTALATELSEQDEATCRECSTTLLFSEPSSGDELAQAA